MRALSRNATCVYCKRRVHRDTDKSFDVRETREALVPNVETGRYVRVSVFAEHRCLEMLRSYAALDESKKRPKG